MNDGAVVGRGTQYRSPAVERALRELAQMPVTEACVSGLCDMCLYQASLCDVICQPGENSSPSRRSEQ